MTYTKLSRDTGMPLDFEKPGTAAPGTLTLRQARQWLQQTFNRPTRPKAERQKSEVNYARA